MFLVRHDDTSNGFYFDSRDQSTFLHRGERPPSLRGEILNSSHGDKRVSDKQRDVT